MTVNTTFQQYLQSAFTTGPWTTDEVIEFVLPLFEEVASFHENNQVGSFENPDTIFLTNGRLDIDENYTHDPINNIAAIRKLMDYQQIHGYTITERVLVDEDVSQYKNVVVNLQVQTNPNEEIKLPVYLPGYQCYEMKAGHHDAQTDIFCLGLILGSIVMGLDLYNMEDLNQFASYRMQPAGLNQRVHPTVCALVSEMTELNRYERSRDLHEIIQRLKYYRDYDPQKGTDLSKLANFEVKKPTDRKRFILSKLRNRLFDTSRRNRLLYYKANARFVNLTVSSVPMVLHYQSINPQLLFTWNEEISTQIIKQNPISLNKYLRFEDHPYLNAQLNNIRHDDVKNKQDYGFSQLKLAIAFLHWHNLKDDIHERIQSPLLLLPVELVREKSLKEERFSLKIQDTTATVNPILIHFLKDLYGINLPDSVELHKKNMRDFFEYVKSEIDKAKQGVKLNYTDKPRIKIVHNLARQTINNYKKRLKIKSGPAFNQIDYSYSEENYKPLGLELFRQKIEPKQSSLEFLFSEPITPSNFRNFAKESATAVKSTFHITDGENNPYSWDFDICNIVLGNFNYKKMTLVGDYNRIAEENIEHGVFSELFSTAPKANQEETVQNNPKQWNHVVSADPTQSSAILKSRNGISYVIQGPPGTGKSQTITNLIADYVARGKSVLFVCEKSNALEVVNDKLMKAGLSELCAFIHDSQGGKKKFIEELKVVYEDFLKNKMDVETIREKRKKLIDEIIGSTNFLKKYHDLQRSINPEAGITTRELIEKLVDLRNYLPKNDLSTKAEIPNYKHWVDFGNTIQDLSKALEETGADPELAKHPFNNLGIVVVRSENPFTLIESLITQSYSTLQHLKSVITQHNIPKEHAGAIEHLKNLIQDSVVLEPLAQSKNLKLVDLDNQEAKEFEDLYRQYKDVQRLYQDSIEENKRWINKFDKQEVVQALELARRYEKSFFGFLNGDWRRLKKQLQQAYNFNAHQLKPTYSSVLEQLKEEYQRKDDATQAKTELEKVYHVDNIDMVYTGVEVLRRKQGDKEIDYLLQHSQANELVLQLSRLNNSLTQLDLQLRQCLYGYDGKTLNQINDELTTIKSNVGLLKDLLPSLRRFAELPDNLQKLIRKLPLSPVQAEALMASKTLEKFFSTNPVFAGVNHSLIKDFSDEIEKKYKELLKVNSDFIRAERRLQFLRNYELSNTSASLLTSDLKEAKKVYTAGRRILEHQMGLTMRYKSIRELASNESGKVLKDIKPVWLMSPLSVSDSLPLDTNFFDVVIFDEASQITLEEGIPALYRAPQTIIVGDDKQMPPTNFFSAKSEDPEDLEIVEGEKADELLSSDADSLLVQGARKLSSTMLSWHYRSRYETLISYSNHAFYKAGLLTIPDKTIHHVAKPLMEVAQPEEGEKNAAELLKGSICFHYLPNSIYENRSNIAEAKYIAFMVRKLLSDNVKESIGVVAFSQEQQGIIEEAIESLAETDKNFDEVLEKAFNRKDDGQFTGLFIKNLENVQGDERDIIIMSVCYGHDANKKMLMNFGPINKKGGEKRLNVIFSRAKKHMAIVSSIRSYHIKNDYNEGANYFKRFLHYAEMVSTGNMHIARSILDSLVPDDSLKQAVSNRFSNTLTQVKAELEKRGYIVDRYVGQSSFKCTLAVKRQPEDKEYSLGILIDDEWHYQNDDLVEQYFQRPSILQQFGWRVINLFAKDWLEDSNRVLGDLLKELDGNKPDETSSPALAASIDEPTDGLVYTRLKSEDGERFWEIAQQANQLHLRSGRVGSKGQVLVRSFDNEQEASYAMDKMIEEQVGIGFIK